MPQAASLSTLVLSLAVTTSASAFASPLGDPCPAEFELVGAGLDGSVGPLAVAKLGGVSRLYASGGFTQAGGVSAAGIAGWDGTTWSPLGSAVGEREYVYALAAHDDGSGTALYAGGSFFGFAGTGASGVARWDGASWSALGGWVAGPVEALASHDEGSGPVLFAGGVFTESSSGATGIARWDGASWSSVGGGVDGGVLALATHDDGSGAALYAAGFFDTAGATAVGSIARWNGTSWSDVGGGAPGQLIAELVSFDDGSGPVLIAAGGFTSIGGTPAMRIARWDGSSWSALGSGLDGTGIHGGVGDLAVFDDGTGPALYVGGTFANAGGVPASSIARWNGSTWSAVGSGATGSVASLATFDAGTGPALYLGGSFTVPDTGESHLTRWGSCDPQAPFCVGELGACPCGNAGAPGHGCDNAQGTGGVALALAAQTSGPNAATLTGTGFPSMASPTVLVLRSNAYDAAAPVVFGDGLRCIATSPLVRLAATVATGGASTHVIGHGAMAGGGHFVYQLWYRNTPSTFCDPLAAFNLSSGLGLDWP